MTFFQTVCLLAGPDISTRGQLDNVSISERQLSKIRSQFNHLPNVKVKASTVWISTFYLWRSLQVVTVGVVLVLVGGGSGGAVCLSVTLLSTVPVYSTLAS